MHVELTIENHIIWEVRERFANVSELLLGSQVFIARLAVTSLEEHTHAVELRLDVTGKLDFLLVVLQFEGKHWFHRRSVSGLSL